VRRARSPVLLILVLGLLLPLGLACSAGWAITARPGVVRQLALPLWTGRRLEIELKPCVAHEAGQVAMWYVIAGHRNRFNPENPPNDRLISLLWLKTAPPCP
jgi:hypothetical protein